MKLREAVGWRLLIVLWAGALLAGGCAGDGDEGAAGSDSSAAADTSAAAKPTEEKAIRVEAGEVRRGDLVVPVFADGAIRTPRAVAVSTKITGELVAVHVRDGDRVEAGALLAEIDSRPYAISLEEARYRHFQALSQIAAEGDSVITDHAALARFARQREQLAARQARGELGREQYQARLLDLELQALEEGAFRQQLYEQRTGLAEARLAEQRARLDLENTEIRAPFGGIVSNCDVVPGENVSVGTQICDIYDNRQLEATVSVLEADLGNLEVGRPARIAIPATGDTLLAQVDVISPHLDETSRTCEVLIRFENPEGRLRPGMFVRAEIAGWVYPDRLQVPKAAVLTRDDRPLVFKVVEDRAQWLYVDIGLQNANWIEIERVFSGGSLEPGDRVVVSDHLTLAHEAKIQVRRTRPPRDRWSTEGAAGEQ